MSNRGLILIYVFTIFVFIILSNKNRGKIFNEVLKNQRELPQTKVIIGGCERFFYLIIRYVILVP